MTLSNKSYSKFLTALLMFFIIGVNTSNPAISQQDNTKKAAPQSTQKYYQKKPQYGPPNIDWSKRQAPYPPSPSYPSYPPYYQYPSGHEVAPSAPSSPPYPSYPKIIPHNDSIQVSPPQPPTPQVDWTEQQASPSRSQTNP